MLTAALVFGILGGIAAVLGGIIMGGVAIPELSSNLTWTFWFSASAILFLASIACGVIGRRGGGEE
jgi:hypothetical protein